MLCGGILFRACKLQGYSDPPRWGEVLDEALDIINGEPASDEHILHVKDLLDRYANQPASLPEKEQGGDQVVPSLFDPATCLVPRSYVARERT